MRSRTPEDLAGRCPRCRLRLERCVCELVRPIPTRVEILVVRHALEGIKSTNTARLAALALPSLRIVEYGARDVPLDPDSLVCGETWLLHPAPEPTRPTKLPDRLVVLDGTWGQTRGMLSRLRPLHALPRLSVAAPLTAPVRARSAPRPEQLSTIEAIAGALDLLESPEAGAVLRNLAESFFGQVRATRGLAGTSSST